MSKITEVEKIIKDASNSMSELANHMVINSVSKDAATYT